MFNSVRKTKNGIGARVRRSCVAAVSAGACLAVVPTAVGSPPPHPPHADDHQVDADQLAARAIELYNRNNYEESARLYMKVYALSKRSSAIFNAARALEEAGKNGNAASLFRLFVTLSDDADRIANARKRLRRLEGKGDVAPPLRAATPSGGDTLLMPPSPPGKRTAGGKSEVEAASVGQARPLSTYVAAGGAIALVATGSALLYLGHRDSSSASSMTIATDTDINRYHDRYASAGLEWWTGAVTTSVGVALGAWTVWSALRKPHGRVTVTPTPSGAVVSGRF